MPHPVSTLLHLPGETHRELWKLDPGGTWSRVESQREDPSKAIQAIEAIAFDSSPFFSLQAGDDRESLDQAVALRWESLGVDTEPPGQLWHRWEVAEENGRILIGTLALHPDHLSDELLHRSAAAFEPSLALYPFPPNHLIIYQELGRYVSVFTRGKSLLHASVLCSRQLDQSAVTELFQLYHSLQSNLLLAPLSGIQLWTQTQASFAAELQQQLGLAVTFVTKPAPRLLSSLSGVMPPVIAIEREVHRKNQQRLRLLWLMTALILLAFVGWIGVILRREQQLQKQLALIEARQPAVENARLAQLRWTALEEAVSPDQSPVEVFHQIVSLLPPEGIRFKEFSMNSDSVIVSGEATSLIHASKFQADLKANKNLGRYTFTAPQPTIMEDNRASFRIEGTLNHGGDLANAAE